MDGKKVIEGVRIIALKQINDGKGKIMHMLRKDDEHFEEFGEIYFSVVNPGIVKGWNRHNKMTVNFAVVKGCLHFALYDDREGSGTKGRLQEIDVGEDKYNLILIPSGVWTSFKNSGSEPAILANCATLPHDPEEVEKCDPERGNIPYDWNEYGK